MSLLQRKELFRQVIRSGIMVALIAVLLAAASRFDSNHLQPPLSLARASATCSGLELSVEMNTTVLHKGKNTTIRIALRNTTEKTVLLTGPYCVYNPDTDIFNLVVIDAQNRTVFDWNAGRSMLWWEFASTLRAGESIVNTCKWDQTTGYPDHRSLREGCYFLKACVGSPPLNVDGQPTSLKLETPKIVFVIR
jgi:hypothetical protein